METKCQAGDEVSAKSRYKGGPIRIPILGNAHRVGASVGHSLRARDSSQLRLQHRRDGPGAQGPGHGLKTVTGPRTRTPWGSLRSTIFQSSSCILGRSLHASRLGPWLKVLLDIE